MNNSTTCQPTECQHCSCYLLAQKQKEEFLKRLTIESRDDGELGIIVHFLALDGIDTEVMSEYKNYDKRASVMFEHDELVEVMSYDKMQLMIQYEDDIVKFLKDNGWHIHYQSY